MRRGVGGGCVTYFWRKTLLFYILEASFQQQCKYRLECSSYPETPPQHLLFTPCMLSLTVSQLVVEHKSFSVRVGFHVFPIQGQRSYEAQMAESSLRSKYHHSIFPPYQSSPPTVHYPTPCCHRSMPTVLPFLKTHTPPKIPKAATPLAISAKKILERYGSTSASVRQAPLTIIIKGVALKELYPLTLQQHSQSNHFLCNQKNDLVFTFYKQ